VSILPDDITPRPFLTRPSKMPNPAPTDSLEYQKMVSGQEYTSHSILLKSSYIALDPILVEGRLNAKRLCRRLNETIGDPEDLGPAKLAERRSRILESLLGSFHPSAIEIEPPFWCDYGYNLSVGKGFYCNYNCCILGIPPLGNTYIDCAKITIGDRVCCTMCKD